MATEDIENPQDELEDGEPQDLDVDTDEVDVDEDEGEDNNEDSEDEEETFTDPHELPDELKPHFKKMQASFTRAMQKVKGDGEKVALYNKMMEDPEGAVKLLAERVGLSVSRTGSGEVEADSEQETDTVRWIRSIINKELGKSLDPMRKENAKVQAQQKIDYLDSRYPDWYLYEDVMADLAKKHPSLKDDLDMLYKLSKSTAEELNSPSRGKGKGKPKTRKKATVASKASTSGRVQPKEKPAQSIDEAFEQAKRALGL